jgi:hypothetical protein
VVVGVHFINDVYLMSSLSISALYSGDIGSNLISVTIVADDFRGCLCPFWKFGMIS